MARKSKIPEPRFNAGLVGGLYTPTFSPADLDLANYVKEVEVEREDIRNRVEKKVEQASFLTDSAPIPLTEDEARMADEKIDNVLARIDSTKEKIEELRKQVDTLSAPRGGKDSELSFKLDISRKPRIKRAIKALFGIKTDTITYTMYKQMLRAKSLLEQEEAEGYAKGFPKKDQEGKDKNKETKKSKKKRSGFLERQVNEEEIDASRDAEEQYERLFPKIARDFVYKQDLEELVDRPVNDVEARRRALQYKEVIDSGRDGSKIFKDVIRIEDDEEDIEELE
jgi:ribosomal protein L23